MAAEQKGLLAHTRTLFLEAVLTFLQVFVQPFLSHLSLWNSQDPTYGRATLPFSPTENRLIYKNPEVKSRQGKAWLDAEAIHKSSSWQRANQSFVHYYVWELPSAQAKEERACVHLQTSVDEADKLEWQSMLTYLWYVCQVSTAGIL